jgi:hypothetical protein
VYRGRSLQQQDDGTRILGLGIGTFFIICFVAAAGLICFFGSFTDMPVVYCIGATIMLVIVLVVLFTAPQEAIDEEARINQYNTTKRSTHTMVRYGIGIALFISSLAACTCLCLDHGIEKIHGKLIEDPIRPGRGRHLF